MTTKDTKDKVYPYASMHEPPSFNPIIFNFIEGQNFLNYYINDVDIKIYSFLYWGNIHIHQLLG